MPEKRATVPTADHLLRYIDKKYVDTNTNKIDGGGFLARAGEEAPSANWLECFDPPLQNQIEQIRSLKRINYHKRGRLARINVGQTIGFIFETTKITLNFAHDPLE